MRDPYEPGNHQQVIHRSGYESHDANGSEQIISRKYMNENDPSSMLDRRHLEDVTNHPQQQEQLQSQQNLANRMHDTNKALIIDDQLSKLDPVSNFL